MEQTQHSGLTTADVQALQQQYGKNDIPHKEVRASIQFIKKFVDPIPVMIEVALLLSVVLHRWADFIIILVLLMVNIGVDFFQQQKAYKAIAMLNKSLAPLAFVVRNGALIQIDARELVPGDIVKINSGDLAPADLDILDEAYLEVDQSAITGESMAIEMKKGDSINSGSIIKKGSTYAKVVATGAHTTIGQSVALVARAAKDDVSHFQKAILKIGKFLIILSSLLIALTCVIQTIQGNPLIETIRFALVLAIASIPVALPAVLSVTMVIGAHVLAQKHAIVSNFKAIEELAGVDQLCIDKTGTITKNRIRVIDPKPYGDFDEATMLRYAQLASEDGYESPIEQAIYAYAEAHRSVIDKATYRIVSFIPFDPERKITEVSFVEHDTTRTVVMGAAQIIQAMVEDKTQGDVLAVDVDQYAKEGFRTIVVAQKMGPQHVVPVGILPLMDPLRDDSVKSLQHIQERGISIKMLTGDNTAIATHIAKELGIGHSIISSSELRSVHAEQSRDTYHTVMTDADVFTEVVPKDKFDIVESLQQSGHIVAMTGDGVNDAPALKKADIGIAVSGATQAAQSAADIVLLDEGLSIIKDAINQARQTFARMQAYATFRISETVRIVCFIVLSILVFGYTPLTAIMIVLLALLNDLPVMAIAYDNAPVSHKPIRWHMRETIIVATVLGLTGLISSFGLFYYLNMQGFSMAVIQTILFVKLDVAGHSTLYLTRTGKKHFWEKPFPSPTFFIPAFSSRLIGTIVALVGIFVQAISWQIVVLIWIYATVWFLINDQIKVWTYKLIDRYIGSVSALSQ